MESTTSERETEKQKTEIKIGKKQTTKQGKGVRI